MKETPLTIKSSTGSPLQFVTEHSRQLSFVVGSHGEFSSGKTRLAVTGPDVTFVLPIDMKSRRTIENNMKSMGKKFGKNILIPPEDFIEHINPAQAARMDEEGSKKFYRTRVERCKEYLLGAHEHKDVRLIVVDDATQLYQDISFACYGREGFKVKKIGESKTYKDKSVADQEYIDLIRFLGTKPLLLLHKSKDDYGSDKKSNKPIGRTYEGYKWTGNLCMAGVQHEFNRDYDEGDPNKNWRFGLSVCQCQDVVELQGPDGKLMLTDDMITMPNLMMRVFPDQDWGDWE